MQTRAERKAEKLALVDADRILDWRSLVRRARVSSAASPHMARAHCDLAAIVFVVRWKRGARKLDDADVQSKKKQNESRANAQTRM